MASKKDERDESPAEAAGRAADRVIGQGAEMGRGASRAQQEQMRNLFRVSERAYRGMTDSGNMDAMMQSSVRFAKGMQDMSWEMMQFTQQSLRNSLKAANDLMTCRSIEDMMEIQRDYLRESMDSLLQESARMLEMGSEVASSAIEPIKPPSQQQ